MSAGAGEGFNNAHLTMRESYGYHTNEAAEAARVGFAAPRNGTFRRGGDIFFRAGIDNIRVERYLVCY
jgi:hypothetical protein